MDVSASSNWYDFEGLASLKAKAVHQPTSATSEISKQFESLFLNLMLKEMRKSIQKSELLGSDAMESYQQMFDQQISLGISKAGGIGIAKYIDAQLNKLPAKVEGGAAVSEPSTGDVLKNRPGVSGVGASG